MQETGKRGGTRTRSSLARTSGILLIQIFILNACLELFVLFCCILSRLYVLTLLHRWKLCYFRPPFQATISLNYDLNNELNGVNAFVFTIFCCCQPTFAS